MNARNGRWKLAAAAAAGCLLFSACGSQVPPKEFVGAQGDLGGGGNLGGNNGAAGGSGNAGDFGPNGGAGTGATGGTGGSGGSGGGGSANGVARGGSGGGSANGGGSGGAGGSGGGSGGSAAQGVKAGSCAGFKNGPGMTNTTINIANVADLSGPVPGLFKSASAAVTAYVAYFNSTSSICGRKLKVQGLDSGTSESGDQQASQSACSSAFAMVGSMGAFDAGGANVVEKCGIPDLRAATTETARQKSPVTYSAYSLNTAEVPTSPFNYFKSLGGGYKDAAFVYLNAGASSLNARSFIAAEEKMGYHFKDKIAIDVTSTPQYDNYVTQLKGDGIKYVQYIGAFQYAQKLKSAMYQKGYNPIFVMDPTAYDANYVSAGKPVDGTYVFDAGPLFEEANKNPQLANYITWLNRTSGGAPTFFGVYAWSAAALFTQLAIQLGGKLSRSSLLAEVRTQHAWSNDKMHPPNDVAGKHTPRCLSVIQLNNGKWVRKTPYPYTCGSLVNSGVGN